MGTTLNHGTNVDNDGYDVLNMLRDVAGEQNQIENMGEALNEEASEFYKLVKSASEPLCPNSEEEDTKLSFVMKLLHFKNKHGCTQKGFDELLELIGYVLPKPHTLHATYNDVKKNYKGIKLGV